MEISKMELTIVLADEQPVHELLAVIRSVVEDGYTDRKGDELMKLSAIVVDDCIDFKEADLNQ